MEIIIKVFLSLLTIAILLLLMLWIAVARPILPRLGGLEPELLPVDKTLLAHHVGKLVLEFSPRDHTHPENLDRAANYIRQELAGYGARVEEQTFTVNDKTYRNVIASLGPSSAGKKIVIGAHYDVASPLPGADDNASGVAGLLELGRLLAKSTLTRNVTLVAYTLEEPPFFGTEDMGSFHHAKSLKSSGAEVDIAIVLEMIGYFSDEAGSQSYPLPILRLFYPNRGNFIALADQITSNRSREMKKRMQAVMKLPVYSINAPRQIKGMDFSDHRNYWAEGYDAIMVTNTAFYRNSAYHTAEDTPDKLNYEKMSQVVAGVFNYVYSLAGKNHLN